MPSPINNIGHRFIALMLGPLFIIGLLLSITTLAQYHDEDIKPTPLLVVELSAWQAPPKPQPVRPTPPQPKPKPAKPIKTPEKIAEKTTQTIAPIAQATPKIETTKTNNPPAVENTRAPQALPTPVPIFKLSQSPRFLHQEPTVYPAAMREQGRQGEVKVAVLIDKTGQVRQITIIKSAGQLFDNAATQALRASTFIPAEVEGKAVAAILRLPVKFRLL